MKILFLAWRDLANPLAGGSEVLIDRLATGLIERGHDVTLVAGGPVGERAYRVVDAGGRYGQYLRAPAIVEREFRDVDLVVDVANGMSYMTPLWRRRPSVCFVNHVHTDQWRLWFNPAVAAVGRTLEHSLTPRLYRNRLFIAVSPSTAEALEGIGVDPSCIRIVPNGVDLVAPAAAKSAEPLFVTLGRLVPHKRIDMLLPIWDRVRDEVGGRLVVVGDGPELGRLQSLAGPGVEFAGHVTEADKQRLLAQAWLLVHPSMLEGWGLVITEAAAAGTPSLAFNAPGVRDSIAHGESGVLATDEDDLAAQWIDLATDWRRRNELALGARRRAAEFSWDATIDRFLEVADEAVVRSAVRTRPQVPAPRPVAVPARAAVTAPVMAGAPELSIVIPAFNEASRLPRSLPALIEAARRFDSEVIVVDDGSTDGTAELAADLLSGAPRPSLLRLPANFGKGAAVRAGVAHASGRNIVFMDADLATDVSHLDDVMVALQEAHVAVGSRAAPGSHVSGATQGRRVMGRVFNEWARAVTGADLTDFQCGFKGFRAPVAKILFDLSRVDGFAFDVDVLALAHRIGYRTTELGVRWRAVEGGKVRPIHDAPGMALSVVRSRVRWTRSRSVAAITAAGRRGWEPEEIAAALAGLVPGFAPVVPWRTGALAILPFTDDPAAARAAVRAQQERPELEVHSARLHTRQLLSPTGRDLRSAIAAA